MSPFTVSRPRRTNHDYGGIIEHVTHGFNHEGDLPGISRDTPRGAFLRHELVFRRAPSAFHEASPPRCPPRAPRP